MDGSSCLRPRVAAAAAGDLRRLAVRRSICCSSSSASSSSSRIGSFGSSRLSWQPQGILLNRNPKFSTKKVLTTVASAKPDEYESESVNAPLEPRTWEGSFLCGLLKSQPHIFPFAAAEQLEELANQRKNTFARWEHSIGSSEDCLHRRIAEMKEQECQIAIEDIMYMLMVYKFYKIEVPMVPNLSKVISNRRLEIWPPRETDLESIHGPEVQDLVSEHLTSIIRWVHRSGPKINRSTLRVKRLQFGRIYAASIMYGYFLKSVSIRHRLELTLAWSQGFPPLNQFMTAQFSSFRKQDHEKLEAVGGSAQMASSLNPSSVADPQNLRDYIMGFDPKTLELCAKLRSQEAANLIEKHSWALFGESIKNSLEDDEGMILDPSSLKRLLLEAIAFGSFLWDVEDYVDEIYKLQDI